jgi:aspartyl-tRNA(Asn)/glutamyl-tRNA(Gln) amidotransferase subunit A
LDAEVSDVVTDAAARLARDRYVELVPLELSLPETAVAAGFVLMAGEGALVHQRWLKSSWHQYDAATRDFLLAGTMLPAAMLASAYAARRELTSCMVKVLDECALDGLLVPTLPLAAKDYADMDNDRDLPSYIRYTVVANITGQPAISIPAGFTARGFPVGISVLGKHGEDEKTLAVAASVEAALGLRFCSPE